MYSLGLSLRPGAPHLPHRGRLGVVCQFVASAVLHFAAAVAIVSSFRAAARVPVAAAVRQQATPVDITHLVFIAPAGLPWAGGGGGGNRQPGPIRRAEAIGGDRVTLRVAKPRAPTATLDDAKPELAVLPALVLDALPLASGTRDVLGLPEGGVSFGTSTGPGSGGGVGDGIGTGMGSGRGPGLGPGSGGGTGGGVYRPGGAVTTPRVITQVKPKYTNDALRLKIQGSVLLEMVVTSAGQTSNIRVVQSLDPGGLDEEAIAAARQWKFDPGRLGGTPVDVLVTLILDFRIQ
jgi:periplasmic protein TonB